MRLTVNEGVLSLNGRRVTPVVLCVQLSACAQPPVEGPPIGEVEPACRQAMQEPPELQLQLPGSSNPRTPVSVPLGELRFHDREFVRVRVRATTTILARSRCTGSRSIEARRTITRAM